MKNRFLLFNIIVLLLFQGCGSILPRWKSVHLNKNEQDTARLLKIEDDCLKKMMAKPLYKFNERELDSYLGYLQFIEPDLRSRIQHLAKKCVNQPYQIFLLGEFPVELYDAEPLFSIKKSDCVVFSEHIYAMALAYDWKSFFGMLQRIRYKDGIISFITRNHYTELDWDLNNKWLVEDITEKLIGDKAIRLTSIYNKNDFFKKWNIITDVPPDTLEWSYVPYELVNGIIDKLQPGDFVNVVRGNESTKWVGHVGLITKSEDGAVNFLHSTNPRVVEQPLLEYLEYSLKLNKERELKNKRISEYNNEIIAKTSSKKLKAPLPYFYGFKFLRLKDDPLWELIKIDGFDAPHITIPSIY